MMMQYEFEQMQDCITALFDCFQRVTLDGQPLEHSLRKLIQQNISFARKMVELSEKFDQLYTRQTHQLNEEIHTAIKKLYGMLPGHGKKRNLAAMDMLEAVAEELLKKNSNSHQNSNMRDSHKERGRSDAENNIRASRTKKPAATATDKSISLKEALTLKRSLQLEEQNIRELFDSANKIITDSQLSSPQNHRYKYQKHYVQQQDASSIMTLVKGNIDSNSTNLQHLKSLLQLITDDVLKSLRKGNANTGQVNLYLSQIQKRQEVFSYTVSKILQSFRTFTNSLDPRHQNRATLQNMEELLNKLFDIYPSADILKDIHLNSPERKQRNIQQYINNSKEVQVNIKPQPKDTTSRQTKKQQIELFRMGVRLNEQIKKLAETIKFKKTVQAKQIDKWLDGLRDTLTTIQQHRPSIAKDLQAQINIFQEEYKRIQTQHQARQTDIKSQYGKIINKYEKSLKAYEQQVQQFKIQLNKSQQRHNKITKKLQHEKQQVIKIKAAKEQLEKIVQTHHHQLEQLRSTIKTEQKQQSKQTKIARSEQQIINRQKQRIEDELRRLAKSLQDKQLSVEQQRNIYKSKIKLIQQRQEQFKGQNGRLKQQLQVMIMDNRVLKERIEHLGQMHQEKIRQSQQLIEQFKKIEGELSQKELECREAKVQITSLKDTINHIEQELTNKNQGYQKLMQEKLRCEDNAKKYKQLGRLNEQDIQMLKEQIEKVKNAYFEAEQQLASLKEAYDALTHEKVVLTETKHKYSEILQDMEGDLQEQRKFRDRSEEAIRLANQELRLKEKQLNDIHSSLQTYKEDRKELARLKKDNAQLRSSLNTAELQLATIKHDIQNATLIQQTTLSQQRKDLKAQNAKYQLEVETLRVQLKNKKEIIEKDRGNFDRQKGILQQKINDLKVLLNEKQNISNRLKLAKHYESIHQAEQHNNNNS